MSRLKNLSIRQKLTLIVMLPSLIALVLASALFMAYDLVSFRRQMVNSSLIHARMIGANCTAAIDFDDPGAAEETLSTLGIHEPIVAAFIFTPDGELFAGYLRPHIAGESIAAKPRLPGAFFEDGYLYVYEPIRFDDEIIGTISIQSDLSELRERVRGYSFTILPVIAIGLAVALSLQARLRGVITRPISHLAHTAQTVSEVQDYSVRAEKESDDELGQLVDRFNEMLTQIQRQDEALREGEARFRNVLDNTRDMLYNLNLRTNEYEYFSPAAVEVTGFEPSELLGLGFAGMRGRVHPDDEEQADYSTLENAEQGGEARSTRVDYRWKNKAGEYIWASENRTVVYGEDGQAVAVVGSFRDVTERKRAEEAIAQMRHHLQSIIDSMPSALISVDRAGAVTQWNEEATRLSGRTTEEAVGHPFRDVFPLLADSAEIIQDAIAQETPLLTKQFTVQDSESKTVYYDLTVYTLRGGDVEGAVIRVDNVSDRVQIEEMMVQTEKMMSVGGLAAGMAHEINNPLGGILQACQNITRRMSLTLPKNRKVAEELGIDIEDIHRYAQERGILEFIEGVRSDGARAAKIVADMLAFSRQSDSTFEAVNIAEMVETVLRLAANDFSLKKHYDFRRVNVVRELDPAMAEVPCDKTKIEQVLLNLVKNAAQAMSEDGSHGEPTLTIRTQREPEHARIEVIDNGPGMSEETRRRVMEPFFTTKPVGVGTGLGLSVSYFIISKQHGGTMNVDSTLGEGTRFVIRLPLVRRV